MKKFFRLLFTVLLCCVFAAGLTACDDGGSVPPLVNGGGGDDQTPAYDLVDAELDFEIQVVEDGTPTPKGSGQREMTWSVITPEGLDEVPTYALTIKFHHLGEFYSYGFEADAVSGKITSYQMTVVSFSLAGASDPTNVKWGIEKIPADKRTASFAFDWANNLVTITLLSMPSMFTNPGAM